MRAGSLPTRERGLKYVLHVGSASGQWSLPTRERGLKSLGIMRDAAAGESLPTRERGLKYNFPAGLPAKALVAPYTGAWIEIRPHTAPYR